MICSARPVSIFADYETGRNDMRDREWERRLSNIVCDVVLRPCLPPDLVDWRFLTEKQLVERVLNGDQHAGRWFVARFERLVMAIVRETVRHAQERQDICQQVFMRLWENDCRRLRMWRANGRGRLSSYLGTVARRTAYDWMRKHLRTVDGRDAALLMGDGAAVAAAKTAHARSLPGDAEADIEMFAIAREEARAVRHVILGMLGRDRELLRRRYFRHQSYAEIAADMNMTIANVGVALHRAQKRMRAKLTLMHPGMFE